MSKCGGPAKKDYLPTAFDPARISFRTWQSQQRTYPFSTFLSPSGFCHPRQRSLLTKSSEKLCNDAIEAFLNLASISFGTGRKCVASCLQCKTDFVTVFKHNKRVFLTIMGFYYQSNRLKSCNLWEGAICVMARNVGQTSHDRTLVSVWWP